MIKIRIFLNVFISNVHKLHVFSYFSCLKVQKKEPINGSLMLFLLELAGGIEPPTY